MKNQEETPYTLRGRELYVKRTNNRPLLSRVQSLLNPEHLALILSGHKRKLYNFEYFMNRCYTFNRDKGKCTICRDHLSGIGDTHTHHIDNTLPIEQINKVPNLATVCMQCHELIHAQDLEGVILNHLSKSGIAKLMKYREKAKALKEES